MSQPFFIDAANPCSATSRWQRMCIPARHVPIQLLVGPECRSCPPTDRRVYRTPAAPPTGICVLPFPEQRTQTENRHTTPCNLRCAARFINSGQYRSQSRSLDPAPQLSAPSATTTANAAPPRSDSHHAASTTISRTPYCLSLGSRVK